MQLWCVRDGLLKCDTRDTKATGKILRLENTGEQEGCDGTPEWNRGQGDREKVGKAVGGNKTTAHSFTFPACCLQGQVNAHAARGLSQRSQDSPPSHTIPELLRYSPTKGTGPVPLIFLSYLVTREQKETVPKPHDPQGQ